MIINNIIMIIIMIIVFIMLLLYYVLETIFMDRIFLETALGWFAPETNGSE